MDFFYAVQNEEELRQYRTFAERIRPRLEEYILFLQQHYEVRDLPQAVFWADQTAATMLIREIPIPAYTNEHRIVMCPGLSVWRKVYLQQLAGLSDADSLSAFYSDQLTENHILQILGHELAHHSELFLEDFEDSRTDGIWFEEGMAEYISRRYFLTEAEYAALAGANRSLAEKLSPLYGNHSLENFGEETYEGDLASIFFEYHRSFLAVEKLVHLHGEDVNAVFQSYHDWYHSKSRIPLSQWFGIN